MLVLNEFQYSLLERRTVFEDKKNGELYNKAYTYWKKTWQKILLESGSPQTWSADDFFRQNYIGVITKKGEVVAVSCSTFFDLRSRCAHETKYFSIFNQKVYSWLRDRRVQRLMSIEFLSVAEKWRSSNVGFSFAEVLIGLGVRLLQKENICAAVGVSVKAAKITQKSSKLNFQLVCDDVERGRLPCDLICLDAKKAAPHTDQDVENIIDNLWKNRNENTYKHKEKLRAVA